MNYSRSISLVSHSATFYCKASGCKQKKNLPPWFIDSPSGPICLPRGGSNEFTVLAYDPNGVEDIAKIAINRPLPPGLSAEVTGIKTVEHGGVLAKLATVTVHWNSGNGAKQIGVYVEDRAGKWRMVSVPLQPMVPPNITVEDGPFYDPGIHAYLMRLRVTNSNSEQLDIGLTAELSDGEAGILRFGLGQGTSSVVVSPGPGDSEEIGLVFYPNPDRHCHITIKIKSSIITKCGVVTEQSWPFAANNQPRIDSIQPVIASAGRVVRVRVSATDEDKDTVTLEQISGPGDLDISQSKPGSVIGIYTWATTKHDPWYLVAFKATDKCKASVTKYLLLHVLQPPRIGSASVSVFPGESATTLVYVEDPDSDDISFDFNTPAGLTAEVVGEEPVREYEDYGQGGRYERIRVAVDRKVEPGTYRIEVKVTDGDGLSSTGAITVEVKNRDPYFEPSSLSEKKTVYYSGGGGSGYSQGPYLLMSPAWAHTYCLTVTDPDGDDLKIGLGSSPRHGAANVLASRTGPGRYNVTIGYQISNDKLREIHESGDDLTDSFTLVVDDGHGRFRSSAASPAPDFALYNDCKRRLK